MSTKIITTKDFEKRAFDLFYDRVEKGDYLGALGIMHARYKKNPKDKVVLQNLADLYSKMEEYLRALFFRFKLLSLTSKENRIFIYKDIAIDVDALENVMLTNFYISKIYDEYGREGMYSVANELSEKLTLKTKFEPFYLAYPPNEKHYKRLLEYGHQAVNSFSNTAKNFFSEVPMEYFDDTAVKDYATAFMFDGDYEGAIKKLKEFIAVKGEKTYIFAYIALAYCYAENNEKLEYYLYRALSSFDGSENEALDLYELIKELDLQPRFLTVYDSLSNACKYSGVYHYEYSEVLRLNGNLEKAQEEILLARKIEPDNKTYLIAERRLFSSSKNEEKDGKKDKNTNFTERAIYLEAFLRAKDTKMAKSAVYTLIENNSSLAHSILDDALIDLEVSGDVKHTIIYAKISFGHFETIRVVTEGKFFEIRPKKLVLDAQKSDFYTAVYALAVSKTFESGLCSENALKCAVNKFYKIFGHKFKSEDDLRDVTTAVCVLAIKDLDKSVLISSFGADEKKVNKYLSEINGGDKND